MGIWGEAQDNFAALQPWTPEAREEVEELQIEGFRSLAAALGLGDDADKAYQRLMGNRQLPSGQDWSFIWRKLGIPPPSDARVREAIEAPFAGLYQRIRSVEPPTRYEDQRNYFDMVLLLAAVLDHLAAKGTPVDDVPLIASLPSGDINARILRFPGVPSTHLLFDQGLFRFCADMANVLAWTVVPLTVEQIGNEVALIGLPRRHTMPGQASESFLGSLYAYVVYGSPMANEESVPRPDFNELLALNIETQMKRFVMTHELSHCVGGHLEKPPSKDLEYEADANSAYIVSDMARESLGSWAVGFWACDFALTAFHLLEKALGVMAYGTGKLRWISETHPDPLSRRNLLRGKAPNTNGVTRVSIAAAEAVCGMTDGLLGQLWEMTAPLLYKAHLDGTRPAGTWRSHLEHDLAPAP